MSFRVFFLRPAFDTPFTMGLTYMYFKRCRKLRVVAQSFVFIQVERDDGGRVLNLSEEGLCFETHASISLNQSVRFWFSFNLRDRLEAIGRLVWMDAKEGIGGLQFTEISDPVRRQIREWIARTREVEAPADEEKMPAVPVLGDPVQRSELPIFVRSILFQNFRPKAALMVNETVSAGKDGSLAQVSEALKGLRELIPLKRHQAALRLQFWRGLLVGLLIPSLTSAIFIGYANREAQGSRVKESSTQDVPGDSKARAESQASQYTPDAPSPFSGAFVAAPRHKAADGLSDGSVGPVAMQPRRESGKSARDRAAESVAPVFAAESTRTEKKATTPDQLWAAVQAGNAKAAVTLADMYLRGDGVPVNCIQAKVLLQVASQKKNARAIEKLHELESTGCPAR